jgi:hypothetical protein
MLEKNLIFSLFPVEKFEIHGSKFREGETGIA